MDYQAQFKGKKITVMGLGLLGRGVGDVAWLAHAGAELIVTDLKTEEQLARSLAQLSEFPSITYVLGEHRLEDFRNRDMILKSAGVPLDSPYIEEARTVGIPIEMSAALLVRISGAKAVGVTGTRGKSTVTHLIAHALREANVPYTIGGNVRDIANLPLLNEVRSDSLLVLELDSWQLQGFGESRISPHISVFTNLKLDHLNYYNGDSQRYFEDKANIFKYQKKGDVLIAGRVVTDEWILNAHPPVAPCVPEALPADWRLGILGEHNRENASLARAALQALGISENDIRKSFETFQPVEGRLQRMREVGGVTVYNDNNSTTPDATIAALAALTPLAQESGGALVPIIGGADKQVPLETLAAVLNQSIKTVVLLPGTGTEKLRPLLKHNVLESQSLPEALQMALSAAREHDILLFSPGFASFGLFKNEYDRNDQFVRLVNAL